MCHYGHDPYPGPLTYEKKYPMARPYTKKEREQKKQLFLEAYDESKGMTTTSCIRTGITKETLSNWRKADPAFDLAVREIDEKWKEWVEGQLMTLIKKGNTSATIFYLKCKAGYMEKKAIEVETKGAIDINAELEEIRRTLDDGPGQTS